MARTKVTDPRTGAVVEVDSKSPLAKLWSATTEEPKKTAAKRSSSTKSDK